jgi:hypothetical protein
MSPTSYQAAPPRINVARIIQGFEGLATPATRKNQLI